MTPDALSMLRRRIKNMRASPMPDDEIRATLKNKGWDRDAVDRAMAELAPRQ